MIEDRDYMREPEKRPVRADWPSFSVLHLVLVLNVVIFLVGPSLLDLGHSGVGRTASNREVCETAGFSLKALAEGRFWTLITHMFVHSGPLHLIGNLVIIFLAGNRLIQLLGSRVFLLAYFVGGLVGATFQVTVDAFVRGANDLSVAGASAGACALGFALAAVLPQDNATSRLYFLFPVNIRFWPLAVSIMLMEAVLGVSALFSETLNGYWGGNAYFAHIGGALFGWYVVRMMGYGGQPMTYSRLWHQNRQQQGRAGLPRAPRPAVARMRRLREAAPEMDHEAIRSKVRGPKKSDLPLVDEVDAVLEKIHRQGMDSITESERRLLEAASRDLKTRPAKRSGKMG
jgi:membrane associated rhomboid family serine protease